MRHVAQNPNTLGLLALLSVVLVGGCGPKAPATLPVSGVVTLDGQPVEKAAVMFQPTEGRGALGQTDAQGRFLLSTVPGNQRVTVTRVEYQGLSSGDDKLTPDPGAGGIQQKWIVPKRYSLPDTSGLSVDVKPGMAPVELKLQTAP
jgi:hypothetical protein